MCTVSLLEDIDLTNGSWSTHASLTRGPRGVLGAYAILREITAPLTSDSWQTVANAVPAGFALHLSINPGFDFTGILVAINGGTEADFTVALAASNLARRQTLVLKLPGISEAILFDVPEVNAEWIRYDFLYRDNEVSLYLNCGLLSVRASPRVLPPTSPYLGAGNDTLKLPGSQDFKVRHQLVLLRHCFEGSF